MKRIKLNKKMKQNSSSDTLPLFIRFKREHNKRKKFLYAKNHFKKDNRENSRIIFSLSYLPYYRKNVEELRKIYEATISFNKFSDEVLFDMILRLHITGQVKEEIQTEVAKEFETRLKVEEDKTDYAREKYKNKDRKFGYYLEIYDEIERRIEESNKEHTTDIKIITDVVIEFINNKKNHYLNELFERKKRKHYPTIQNIKSAYYRYKKRN